MAIRGWRGWLVCAVALAGMSMAAAGCKTTPSEEGKPKSKVEPTGPHASVLKLFPGVGDVSDWKASGDAKVYALAVNTAEGVEALDTDIGTNVAQVRGYDFIKSGVRRYVRGQGGETVTVRVFEMKKPQDAFGLFTVSSAGTQFPRVGTALAARMSTNTLAFVKGPCLVTVEYNGSNAPQPVLMEFGRYIADQISAPGYLPAILESFPLGAQEGERYFLHTFPALTSLPFVPKGDAALMSRMLSLTPETDIVIMGYSTSTPGAMNYLFVIHYPNEAEARSAYEQYDKYLENSKSPAEQNVAVAPPVHGYLAGTFNAEENSVNDQLAKLLAGLGG